MILDFEQIFIEIWLNFVDGVIYIGFQLLSVRILRRSIGFDFCGPRTKVFLIFARVSQLGLQNCPIRVQNSFSKNIRWLEMFF